MTSLSAGLRHPPTICLMFPGDQGQREVGVKPAFINLRENYSSVAAVDQAALFREIG
ncbi:hypothetical protein [Janthinobacterium sp. BJB301]|uniref:hypothetical protein n=1 Tax=Janthinobacterium sp. BJB301 TaxID=1560195 RepID=UPI0015D4A735|nr:hypothetical protein [Janthinobacterium sp. BJB301]